MHNINNEKKHIANAVVDLEMRNLERNFIKKTVTHSPIHKYPSRAQIDRLARINKYKGALPRDSGGTEVSQNRIYD